MIHGRGSGLDIVFAGRGFGEALDDLRSRLVGGPDFYRGTRASVIFESTPAAAQLESLRSVLAESGMAWEGAYGESDLEPVLAPLGIPYLGRAPHPTVAPMPPRERAVREVELSDSARSLIADFAGARADLAQRRVRGVRRRQEPAAPAVVPALGAPSLSAPASASAPAAPPAPAVLYHRGTLRGGQALANVGHIVVVGDVNPGAELVAGGDIVVFGQLRGVAHAGAQGDRSARVYALVLSPTQLRIATSIAAGDERPGSHGPEEAFISTESGDRIAIVAAGNPPLPRASSEHGR